MLENGGCDHVHKRKRKALDIKIKDRNLSIKSTR
jgi:hypothetical protein